MFRFSDISITKKLFLIMAIMAVLITTELVALNYTIKTFSAVRAYVGGEGLWSKAQKNASYYLIKYAYTHSEKDYQAYLDFLKVSLSDHQARLALSKNPIDYDAARKGFQGGRIHPDDVDGVIWLFSTFNQIYYINKAIKVWTEADNLMVEFLQLGNQLHNSIANQQATSLDIAKQLVHIDKLNDELTAVEDEFSYTLGQASRWLENLILKLLIGVAITVEFTGIFLTIMIGHYIAKNINAMNKVAKKIATSDYTERVIVTSQDEIGQLATSFNTMIDELDKNIKRKNQAELALTEKNIQLENANLAKDQFLSHMSHELRTPLNGVITMTQLLATSHLTADQQEQLDIIKESEDQLLFVINQILDFSKIKSGRITVEKLTFNLRELIKKSLAVYEVKSSLKNIQLSHHIHPSVSVFYIGDPIKIHQVLSNLLDNAIKFTNSGNIDVTVSPYKKNGKITVLLFEITDTGIGITPEIHARLFDSFSQGDASMTRKYGGTGLGLAISKNLIETMGGVIDVEAKDNGSRFYFTVPLNESEQLFHDNKKINRDLVSPLVITHKNKHILLAEDNKLNQRSLKLILEKHGYLTTVVSDGLEVLEMLNKASFDLILMDCQMPNLDGYITTQTIRQNEQAGNRPMTIIGVTAHATKYDRKKCLDAGMNNFISKPLNIDELLNVIRSYLS